MSNSNSNTLESEQQTPANQTYIDGFGRPVDYLRVSLTQRCNHFCFFCHHEGESHPKSEMTLTEIEKIVVHATRHGVRRLKLTGGEPLLREDILDIVRMVSPLVEDLSMTTNGTLLEDKALDLKRAGLSRVNISLHSLKEDTYHRITGTNNLETVKRGIKRAVEVGLSPVKLNMTVLHGFNESEIMDMMEFAAETGCILQLIELQHMPNDDSERRELWFNLDSIEDEIGKRAIRTDQSHIHRRKQYVVKMNNGCEVKIEVVRPMHNSMFCEGCTRLRVTSDGKLKPCLLRSDNLVEILFEDGVHSNKGSLELAFKEAVKNREPYWRDEHIG
ncbi:MAG: GTP 3',8-cyclase MoaA [Candidatus Thorarchaeota archaeon]|nr:GTP 3',8-cyclase MoaA [Candidatus Thorarchaeota archaeon]